MPDNDLRGTSLKGNFLLLSSSQYIRECLLWNRQICLKIVERSQLDVGKIERFAPSELPPQLPPKNEVVRGETNRISLWDITPSTMLRLKVHCALNIMADANMWVSIYLSQLDLSNSIFN